MIMGNYNEASKSFKALIEIEESVIGYFNLLIALNALGDTGGLKYTADQATRVFERYLDRQPKDSTINVRYAFVLFWAGKQTEASELAESLLDQKELGGYALYNLGCLFDELGNPERFIHLLKKAIQKGYREIEQTRNYVFTTKSMV